MTEAARAAAAAREARARQQGANVSPAAVGPTQLAVGTTVRLLGLAGRPKLNGQWGVISNAASEKTGRCGVLVPEEPKRLAIKPNNLALAYDAVAARVALFSDQDLLRAVFVHLERWERAGVITGVSHSWRRAALAQPDLWRLHRCGRVSAASPARAGGGQADVALDAGSG